jgi:hypothetical protein
MGKTIIFRKIILLLPIIYCCCRVQTSTPKEYLHYNKVNHDVYTKDSIYILSVLNNMVVNNIPPFKSKHFDNSTYVYIDTLIYSPDNKRLALWIITKNSNTKLISTNNKTGYHYNGNCMYASRGDLSANWNVYERSFFEVHFLKSPIDVRKELFLYSFIYKSTFKRTDNMPIYNINDIRFWTEITWDESILKTPSH